MLIRQLFDYETYSYTYIIADENTRKAAIIDPALEQADNYLILLKELNLKLILAIDTHVHTDQISGLGLLKNKANVATYIGNVGTLESSEHILANNQVIALGDLNINVIYTPGHTDDSFCFYVKDNEQGFLFSGDTLLIRGTGRTDFHNGDAVSLYESLHNKLVRLPGNTIVYPGHDYKGWTQSTIEEERKYNPRLQIKRKNDFVKHMESLVLKDPKFMDIPVSDN